MHPAARSDPKVVPPAYYVELRALETRKEGIEAAAGRHRLWAALHRLIRPWPFHQPLPEAEPPVVVVESRELPAPAKGRYLDILA